jgi:hypothetical protein
LNFDTADTATKQAWQREICVLCIAVFVFSYLIFCRKTDKEDKMKRWLKSGSLKQSKDNVVNPLIDLNQDDAAAEETEPLLQQSASTRRARRQRKRKKKTFMWNNNKKYYYVRYM